MSEQRSAEREGERTDEMGETLGGAAADSVGMPSNDATGLSGFAEQGLAANAATAPRGGNDAERRHGQRRGEARPDAPERRTPAAVPNGGASGSGANGSARSGALEAPHRRTAAGPRIIEKTGVRAYRATSWVFAHVPERLASAILGMATQASYLAWSKKRRSVNLNFAHVLGGDPDSGAVRKMALRAYRSYARYLVELMRLPNMPPERTASLVELEGIENLERAWRESGTPFILVAGHVGSNEAVAAGIAWKGYPISVVADDSSFPEMFELLKRQREAWGVQLIPWRNLRDVYGVLRRGEILALLVDWGYRDDGIPVRLFGAWTTLPAGPAALAAKTGATILPIVVRRQDSGRYLLTHDEPIRVASGKPAELARATQAIADALERTIAAAPDQWYSFKPMWPETSAEKERLAQRAASVTPRLDPVEGAG